MPQAVRCSGCEKSFRIPDDKLGRTLKCPNCGGSINTKAIDADDEFDDLLDAPAPAIASKRKSSMKSAAGIDFPAFAKQVLLIMGGLTAAAVLIGIGGFFSEVVALVAACICVLICMVALVWGRVWMAIDLGNEKLWLGFAAFFIPIVGIAVSARNKGPSLRGAIVMMSSIVPILFGLGMITLFRPMYDSGAKTSARARTAAARLEDFGDRVDANAPVETAVFKLNGPAEAITRLKDNGDSILKDYTTYIPGSLTIDAAKRTATLQYRGSPGVPLGFALVLKDETNAMLIIDRSQASQ